MARATEWFISGRVDERRALSAALADRTILLLSGEPGSGKTTLLDWVEREAREVGVTVLRCRAAEIESTIAVSAVSELLSTLDGFPAQLSSEERSTLASLQAATPTRDRESTRHVLSVLLAALAADGPTLILLDDAQWVDDVSAEALAFAIRRGGRNVAVVAACRDGWVNTFRDALVGADRSRHLRLSAMGEVELADLAARELGGPRPICLTIGRLAAGSPLRARELARLAAGRSADVLNFAHVDAAANPFRLSVASWDLAALEVLFAAFQLRDPEVDRLTVAFGAELALDAVTAAERAGIVTVVDARVRPSHSLVVDAVAARLTPGARAAVHTRLHAGTTDPIERAWHASLSDLGRSDAVAEEIAVGVRRAIELGWLVLAHQLAARVDTFLPSGRVEARARAQMLLALAEFRQDLDLEARDRLRSVVAELPPSPTRLDASLMLANIEAWSTDPELGAERYFEVLTDDTASDEQRAEAATHLAILQMGAGDAGDADALAVASRGWCGGDGQRTAEAEAVAAAALFFAGKGFDSVLLDHALAIEDIDNPLSLQGPPTQWAPFLWYWSGDSRAADGFVHRRQSLSRLGFTAALSLSLSIETRLLLEHGERQHAEQLVARSRDTTEFENPLTDAMVAVGEACLLTHAGGADGDATALLDHADALLTAMSMGFGLIESRTVRMALLARVDPPAAIEFGLAGHRDDLARGISEPALVPGAMDLVEALLFAEHEEAVAFGELLFAAHGHPSVVLLQRWWRACAAAAGPSRDVTLLDALSAELAADGDRFWSARAAIASARVLRRSGQRTQSRQRFDDAAALLAELEAGGWLTTVRAERARVESRVPSGNALTEGERSVAVLAAEGHSNREIAARLFMSEKTVEGRLSVVYRKLGVSRRGQLHAALDDR